MYCGEHLQIDHQDIDHRNPVARGGSHETSNLQLLCRPCNNRKGVHTDQEFRSRFRSVLAGRIGRGGRRPPSVEIPQEEFRIVASNTPAAEGVREYNRTKFVSPRVKISGGAAFAGIIIGVTWFFGLALLAGAVDRVYSDALTFTALIGGVLLGLAVWFSIVRRAKHTGRYED